MFDIMILNDPIFQSVEQIFPYCHADSNALKIT